MTSLFFVMLVLFVLVIVLLHNKMVDIENERKATQEQIDKIMEIEEAVRKIDPAYFEYREEYKKHILKIDVEFPANESSIDYLDMSKQKDLISAGRSIQNSIEDINKEYPTAQYLLIIEGQASKDTYKKNFELSYERALSLKRFWDDSIKFSDNCEILISGSGTEGTMRHLPESHLPERVRDSIESKNQRFLIHIVPKPGVIEQTSKKSIK
jgi:hypothetical protein